MASRLVRLLLEERANTGADERLARLVERLRGRRALLVTTSNRFAEHDEKPKSTLLAEEVAAEVGGTLVDAAALNIAICEGNVSGLEGNGCGGRDAVLKDRKKNPTGFHRCWASINNPDDELWKVSKPLLDSDAVVFFASVRWGQTNSVYQKLIERLTWLENRWATLGEDNVLSGIEAGIVTVGHNWRGGEVVETQRKVLQFFGFDTPEELSMSWQWTPETGDETRFGYEQEPHDFVRDFDLVPVSRLRR
jgi:multimeric flavodoxin WrbA